MVFDSHVGKTILFGGDHLRPFALGGVNDTWSWDGNQWTRLWTDAAPVGRMGQNRSHAAEQESSAQEKMRHMGGGNDEPARRKKSVLSSKDEITDEKAKGKLRQMGDND